MLINDVFFLKLHGKHVNVYFYFQNEEEGKKITFLCFKCNGLVELLLGQTDTKNLVISLVVRCKKLLA